jgi:REP element-mobilizing transposase RayT
MLPRWPTCRLLHLVARAAAGARPFRHRHACAELWSRVLRNFDVVALALMPDHVHLLAEIERDSALRTFGRVLSAFRSKMRASTDPDLLFDWERLPSPEKVQRDRRHIARTIRYIHLNPTRAALCSDPREWEWSTHRDWLGAVARPCVDRARWGNSDGKTHALVHRLAARVMSSDPSVPGGRPPVDPAPFLLPLPKKDASIDALLQAVPRALRSPRMRPHEFDLAERRLFLLSAAQWTRYSGAELARSLGCDPRSAQRTIRQQRDEELREGANSSKRGGRERGDVLDANELHAMAVILADPRLTAAPGAEATRAAFRRG